MDITKLMQEQMDDAAELAKRPPDPANLASQIKSYINNELSAPEMDILSKAHGPQIDAEIKRREQVAQRKKELDEKNALRIFDGVFTDNEEQAARQACFDFGQKHPVIRGNVENQLMLLAEVQNRKQFVTLHNLEAAYRDLSARKAFIEVVEPVQSAAQFKAAHIEDWPAPEVPPLVLARIGKILDTFSVSHPEYVHSNSNLSKLLAALPRGVPISLQSVEEAFHDVRAELDLSNASQRGEVLRYTDMGGRPQGFPKESEKYSFKIKIRSMTADQIAQRCLDDPAFKQALDNL